MDEKVQKKVEKQTSNSGEDDWSTWNGVLKILESTVVTEHHIEGFQLIW